jgi:tRNA(Arg) A34 adenosine deaminase TadA
MSFGGYSPAWQAALEMAWEAYCDDCVPIGAVAADTGGRVLACGRNRIYARRGEDGIRRGKTLAHAEIEALHNVDYDALDPHSGVLYTTMEPCPMCLGTFYMSGFRTLHYAARDPYAGSADLLGTTPYLSRKPIRVHAPFDTRLEIVLQAMYIEYELALFDERIRKTDLFPHWQNVVPQGVTLGENLFHSGELRRERDHWSASQAFDWLLAQVEGLTPSN